MSRAARLCVRAVALYVLLMLVVPYVSPERPVLTVLWVIGFVTVWLHLPLVALAGSEK